jgi:two-component system cell cycle sensor histidine kinase/response regulator CckA
MERANNNRLFRCTQTPFFRDLLARMIKSLGCRVGVAANGGGALMTIEKEHLLPDLLVTDVVMPEMSGRVLAERLSQLQSGLKALYISWYTDSAIVHYGVLDSRMPFLQKPFCVTDLAAKIREVLRDG